MSKMVHGWAFPDVDEFMAHELKADGSYQGSHLRHALAYVTDRTTAIDGGAHVGTWAKPMSEWFDRVIAIEPSVDTFEALRANMRHHGCQNVEIMNVALGAHLGHVTMVLDGRGADLKNTGARHARPDGSIPVLTIDSLALSCLGFLKLDVEGSEVAALQGAEHTIARCHPVILFENKGLWKTHFGLEREAPQVWLTAHGYQHREKVGCDAIWTAV